MIKKQANALLSQFKSIAPHSQFTHTLDHQVRTLQGMIAAGKSQASIDAHMKLMNRTIVDAQRQAYAPHATPQAGQFAGSHFGQAGQQFGHGQLQGAGHMGAMGQQTNAHPAPLPSAHALDNARAMMRNMSKISHGGNALF